MSFLFSASAIAMPNLNTTLSVTLQNDVNGNGDANPGDTLEYELQVRNLGSQDATMARISSINDPNTTYVDGSLDVLPFAVVDNPSISEDATPNTISGNLLTNDAGEDPGETLRVISVAGSTVPGMIAGSYGVLSWSSNGVYSYQLDNGNPSVQALDSGQSLTDSFAYSITDGGGETDSDRLNVVIQGEDEILNATDDTYDTWRNAEIIVDVANGVLANDIGMGLSVTSSDFSSAKGGAVSVATDGSFIYSGNLALGETDSFSYTMSDSFGNMDTGTVTLTGIGRIFYVDNTGGMTGTGTSFDPFNTLASAFSAANQANDFIYVAEGDGMSTNQDASYTPVANNISFIGSGVDLMINNVVQVAATNPPVLGSPDNVLTINNMNFLISGFDFQPFGSPMGSDFSIEAAASDGGTYEVIVKDVSSTFTSAPGLIDGFATGTSTLQLMVTNVVGNGLIDSCLYLGSDTTAALDVEIASLVCSGSSLEGVYAYTDDDSTLDFSIEDSTLTSNLNGGFYFEANSNAQSNVAFNGNNTVQNHQGSGLVGITLFNSSTNTLSLGMTAANGVNNLVTNNDVGICNESSQATVTINPGTQVSGNGTNIATLCSDQ